MLSPTNHTYAKNEVTNWPIPNYWDALALLLVISIVFLFGLGAHAMMGRFNPGDTIPISLSPTELPYYALRTVLRMLIAICCSLIFAFTFATWAAKSRYAERIIIPMIDILQSVPVLGFLSIAVVGFIVLFQGSLLGPECAAIFAIFTAQVWNIALSFYQSLKLVPNDLHEASQMLQLSAWQKFWRIEVPFAMPGLVWNVMLSMSGSWIFLVASEAISVANHEIYLPGVGSYIATAIAKQDLAAIGYVIITMIVVISLIDQLLFRPLVAFAEKFKMSDVGSEDEPESWLLDLFQRTRFLRHVMQYFGAFTTAVVNLPWLRKRPRHATPPARLARWRLIAGMLWNLGLLCLVVLAVVLLIHFILREVPLREVVATLAAGAVTGLRVLAAIVVSSLIWVPLGVMIGLNSRATRIVQPIAQFLAAFPMNLVFPVLVMAILRYQLNVDIWVSPLMILGAQWYILFNVIAGTAALPRNLHYAVGTLNVSGWLWWRRLMLPAIYPYYITGAITAAGAAWNVSIVAEAVSWGPHQLYATGLGAYIVRAATEGDFQRLALGIVVMSLYVLVLNRCLWRPLYNLAEVRYRLN